MNKTENGMMKGSIARVIGFAACAVAATSVCAGDGITDGVHGYTPKGYVQTVPGVSAAKVVHLASGQEFACTPVKGGVTFTLPAGFGAGSCADVFRIVK